MITTKRHSIFLMSVAIFTLSIKAVVPATPSSSVVLLDGSAGDPSLAAWAHADAATQAGILRLARAAFDAYVLRHETIACPRAATLPVVMRRRVGVFVSTMGADGAPRCCMGTLDPLEGDAAHEIIRNAATGAGRDLRFRPIRPADLRRLRLIVTVVGRPIAISEAEAKALDPARDALVVQNGDRFGVMLSGETADAGRMIHWGRVRAGADDRSTVRYYRVSDVRFMEAL